MRLAGALEVYLEPGVAADLEGADGEGVRDRTAQRIAQAWVAVATE